MKHLKLNSLAFFLFLVLFVWGELWAQGPKTSYYYHQATELPFAECYVYQQGGSRQKIPFLPVVSSRAPLGSHRYSKDISVKAPVVFVGNGVVKENIWNSYVGRRYNYTSGEIDITGKAVMFCYDFPDNIEAQLKGKVPLEARISEAALRKASAVILFSWKTEYPFLYLHYEKESGMPDIPVITITKESAVNILESSGLGKGEVFEEWKESGKPQSLELISRIELRIDSNFEEVETGHFLIRFRKNEFPKEKMEELAQVNEKSLKFLFDVFKEELKWKKQLTVYFRDFDSKIFYTRHWGWGKSDEAGVFMIFLESARDYGIAVHENTHSLTNLNWSGDSTSFLTEGIAKYTEALATEKNKNHLATIKFLKDGNLFPLEEMVAFTIGISGLKTMVAYPASGSFTGFLIDTYGLKSFKKVFILEARPVEDKNKENSWRKAYGKSLLDLEKEWLSWLVRKYNIDKKYILDHMKRVEEKQKARLEKKEIKLSLEELKKYEGSYYGKEMGRRIAIEISDGKLVFTTPDAPGFKSALKPEGKHSFKMEGGAAGGELLVFTVDEAGKALKVCIGHYCFDRE
jgi:uncharacterized protein (DUF3820 family)